MTRNTAAARANRARASERTVLRIQDAVAAVERSNADRYLCSARFERTYSVNATRSAFSPAAATSLCLPIAMICTEQGQQQRYSVDLTAMVRRTGGIASAHSMAHLVFVVLEHKNGARRRPIRGQDGETAHRPPRTFKRCEWADVALAARWMPFAKSQSWQAAAPQARRRTPCQTSQSRNLPFCPKNSISVAQQSCALKLCGLHRAPPQCKCGGRHPHRSC